MLLKLQNKKDIETIKESFDGPNNTSWKLKSKQLSTKVQTLESQV